MAMDDHRQSSITSHTCLFAVSVINVSLSNDSAIDGGNGADLDWILPSDREGVNATNSTDVRPRLNSVSRGTVLTMTAQ